MIERRLIPAGLTLPALLALTVLVTATPAAAEEISAAEARHHIGEKATVCGEVASTRYAARSRGRRTFLNIDEPFPDHIFTALIWGDHRSKFPRPPEDLYRDEHICVTGRITSYRGVPQVEVNRPSHGRSPGCSWRGRHLKPGAWGTIEPRRSCSPDRLSTPPIRGAASR